MKLKDYCVKEKITMTSIAKALGYSVRSFLNAAAGVERFSYARAKTISEYCNGEVTVDDLIPFIPEKRCSKCNQVIRNKKGGG